MVVVLGHNFGWHNLMSSCSDCSASSHRCCCSGDAVDIRSIETARGTTIIERKRRSLIFNLSCSLFADCVKTVAARHHQEVGNVRVVIVAIVNHSSGERWVVVGNKRGDCRVSSFIIRRCTVTPHLLHSIENNPSTWRLICSFMFEKGTKITTGFVKLTFGGNAESTASWQSSIVANTNNSWTIAAMATLIVASKSCHEHCVCNWRIGVGVLLHVFDMINQLIDAIANGSGITNETVVTATITNQTNEAIIVIGVVWLV